MQTTHNENKRKKVFLIATLLLALLLIFAFGTYSLSKYVSKDSGEGNATIAKWGYKVKVDATNLFGQKYANTSKENPAQITTGDNNLVVQGTSGEVIAPGTTGSMTISVTGNAEVLAKLTYDFGESSIPSYTITTQTTEEPETTLTYTYAPVELTLQQYKDSGFKTPDGNAVTGLDNIKGKLSAQTYATGSEVSLYYKITWKWAFTKEGAVKPNEEGKDTYTLTYDDLDTIIGIYSNQDNEENVEYNGATYMVSSEKNAINLDLTISLEQQQTNPSVGD